MKIPILRPILFKLSALFLAMGVSAAYAGGNDPVPTIDDSKDIKKVETVEKSPLKVSIGIPSWLSAISGKLGAKGRVSSAQYISVQDVLGHLDYVIPGSIAMDYGKWGVLVEGQFTKLSETLEPSRDRLFNSGDIEMEQAFADFNISYKVVETETCTVAPFIGTRFEYVRLQGSLSATPLNPVPRPFNSNVSTAWADPIFGLQGKYRILPPLSVVAKADVGGFGAASDLTYELFAGAQVQITRNIYANAGYRYLYTDYTSGGFTYEMAFSGPQLTLGVNF